MSMEVSTNLEVYYAPINQDIDIEQKEKCKKRALLIGEKQLFIVKHIKIQ